MDASPKNPFRVLGINHIGIAAKAPDTTAGFFDLLGLSHLGDELVKEQQTLTRMFSSGQEQSARLELLLPEDNDRKAGPIGQYLSKRGGGIHHIALNVDSLENAIQSLLDAGVEMIHQEPQKGAHNTKIAFVHPRAAGGVLIELVEHS